MSYNVVLQSPQATPRPALVSLPPAGGVVMQSKAVPQDSRKRAREERLLQFAEEERLEDEQAVRKLLSHVVTLPFDTALEYHDLDGLLPWAAPFESFVQPLIERDSTVVSSAPASPYTNIPVAPLACDATIRAHAPLAGRRYHPLGPFAVPKSPRLDSQRRPNARRRLSERAYRTSQNPATSV